MQTTQPQPLAATLPAGHLIGLVRWFDSRPDKQFGFITTDWNNGKEKDIFFHLNDNVARIKGEDRSLFGSHPLDKPQRKPEMGDVVIFRTSPGRKGPKASPWAYWKEWEAVSLSLNPQPLYRVIGHYPPPRGSTNKQGCCVRFWSGISLEVFYLRFPDCREDLGAVRYSVRHTDTVENIHIEILPAGLADDLSNRTKWQPYDPNQAVTNELPKLSITARYGVGGHESEYVIGMGIWKDYGSASGYEPIKHPYEFGKALEEVCQSQPISRCAMDRGNRIEVYHTAVKRGVREPFDSRTSFSPNHPEMERLIREALKKVEKDLEEIRRKKVQPGYDWADENTSQLIRDRNLTFEVSEIEVK
jgi:cold shock CspA family protein